MMMATDATDLMALRLLIPGPHCIGVIDDENKMAAALVFISLHDRGLVKSQRGPAGPSYSLTAAGRRAILANDALPGQKDTLTMPSDLHGLKERIGEATGDPGIRAGLAFARAVQKRALREELQQINPRLHPLRYFRLRNRLAALIAQEAGDG